MTFSVRDIISLTQARATLSEIAEQARAGSEKIITRNGEGYVALISAEKLAYYHRLERERLHLLCLDDARQGFEDIAAGRSSDAPELVAELRRQRGRDSRG
jgi:prevent-host-death family protein